MSENTQMLGKQDASLYDSIDSEYIKSLYNPDALEEIKYLNKEIESLKKDNAYLKKRIQQDRQLNQGILKNVQFKEKRINKMTQIIKQYEIQIEGFKKNDVIAKLQKRRVELESTITQCKSIILNKEQEKEYLRKQVSQKDSKVKSLFKEKQLMKSKYESEICELKEDLEKSRKENTFNNENYKTMKIENQTESNSRCQMTQKESQEKSLASEEGFLDGSHEKMMKQIRKYYFDQSFPSKKVTFGNMLVFEFQEKLRDLTILRDD